MAQRTAVVERCEWRCYHPGGQSESVSDGIRSTTDGPAPLAVAGGGVLRSGIGERGRRATSFNAAVGALVHQYNLRFW